jgi:flagellar basal-body rod protein FlgF
MFRGFNISGTGMVAFMEKQEVIANNLANCTTTGFKVEKPVFRGFSYVLEDENAPVGIKLDDIATDFSKGGLTITGNSLDLAIDGDGFFAIQTKNGVMYTRAGNFCLNALGQLTTKEGDLVLGEKESNDLGPINLEEGDISIDKKGRISIDGKETDTIKITNFMPGFKMHKIGSNLFVLNEGIKTELQGELKQGYLENSTVNPITEMLSMISTLRAFEGCQKVISAYDLCVGKTISEVGSN